jgi:hypothetical protein
MAYIQKYNNVKDESKDKTSKQGEEEDVKKQEDEIEK